MKRKCMFQVILRSSKFAHQESTPNYFDIDKHKIEKGDRRICRLAKLMIGLGDMDCNPKLCPFCWKGK